MHVPTCPATRFRLESGQEGGGRTGEEGKDLAGGVLRSRGGFWSLASRCRRAADASNLVELRADVQRHKLKPPLTPVTAESFAIWKKTRVEKKQAEADALEKAKAAQRQAGKMTGMTGKDMFDFGGELYADADEEAGEDDWDISRLLARYVSA